MIKKTMFGSGRRRWLRFVEFKATSLCSNKSAQRRSSFCTSSTPSSLSNPPVCLSSSAVYLVAQYARYEIRTMEAEVEQKRKQKEEEEAKEREKELKLNPPEETEAKLDPQLSEMKERLAKLEETVKEIAVVTKKQSSSKIDTNQVTGDEKKAINLFAPSNTSGGSVTIKPVEEDSVGKDNSLKSRTELDEESKGSVATPSSFLRICLRVWRGREGSAS